MSDFDHHPDNGTDSLEPRTERALREKMTVLPDDGGVPGSNATDMYRVTTESGSEYVVDVRAGRCSCPDARLHLDEDERCKHERRVRFAIGERPIPPDVSGVDPQLGEHVPGTPVVAATDGGRVAATDGDAAAGRPDDCECETLGGGRTDLPCWPCYREGFEAPAN